MRILSKVPKERGSPGRHGFPILRDQLQHVHAEGSRSPAEEVDALKVHVTFSVKDDKAADELIQHLVEYFHVIKFEIVKE